MKKKMVAVLLTADNGNSIWQQDVANHPIPEVTRKSLIPSELSSLQSMVLLITAEKVS